jgi:eukaryotic-like serine/threonine-protein kinase
MNWSVLRDPNTKGELDHRTCEWRTWRAISTLVVVFLALLLLLLPQVREFVATLLATGRVNHIAGLPFDNLSNDPAMDSVVQGLMESMTSELSNLSSVQQSLWVVPASVVRSRKITDPSAAIGTLRKGAKVTLVSLHA